MLATIYFILMVTCGSFLIISLILGQIVEGIGELGEDIGNIVETAIEALPLIGDVELTGDIEIGGVGFGFFRSILAFVTCFGGGGWWSLTQVHVSEAWSVACGLATGGIACAVTFLFFRFLATQEATSAQPTSAYIEKIATVTVSIKPDVPGAISVAGLVGREVLTAYADESIPVGSLVRIVSVEGGTAHVAKEPRS